MKNPSRSTDASRLVGLITVVVIVAVLYLAREVLVPIALAILLCFVLAPLVTLVQRLHIGRVLAVLLVTACACCVVAAVGWIVGGEVIDLADKLPEYRQNIRSKVQGLNVPGGNVFTRATKNIEEIGKEVIAASTQPDPAASQAATAPSTTAPAPARAAKATSQPQPEPEPMPVRIVQHNINPFQSLGSAISPLLPPLATTGIVIVFVIFMLISRESLRDRIIRLAGEGQMIVATQALDDAARRVSRYLVVMLIVATIHGTLVAVGLLLIGVPQAILWGAISLILRFVPYIGPWIAAAFPILLMTAMSDTWYEPSLTIGLFVVLELITNNVLEPVFYGSGTGVSSVGILVSAVFWAWLWGGPGLVLATPMTVCLVVIGQHFPRMRFLAVLLSDEPGLQPEMRVYQRLLAMDQDSVFQIAKDYVKDHSFAQLYDSVFVPALSLAEQDRHRGAVDTQRSEFVFRGLRDVIEDLPTQVAKSAEKTNDQSIAPSTDPARGKSSPLAESHGTVLCVPANDEADEVVGEMLAQLLVQQGVTAVAMSGSPLVSEILDTIEKAAPRVICVSAMPPIAVIHARHLCKRICARYPDLPIIVGVWNASDPARVQERIRSCGTEQVVTTLQQATDRLRG